MKKAAFILVSLIVLQIAGFAQTDSDDRIQALRIAFITEKLSLTPQESQDFWPVFNQYTSELQSLRKSYHSSKDVRDMSNEEAEDFLAKNLDLEQKELDLKRTYMQRLKKVLPARKIAMLGVAERQFKAKLLERFKQRNERGLRPNRFGGK